MVVDDGRLFEDDVVDALLGAETSVGGVSVASLLHNVGEARNNEACGRACV